MREIIKKWLGSPHFETGLITLYLFFIFFLHRKIDFMYAAIGLVLIFAWAVQKIHWRFFTDWFVACILLYFIIALVSSFVNSIHIDKPIKILNWLFPYYLAKYFATQTSLKQKEIEKYFVIAAILFLIMGLGLWFFGFKSFSGYEIARGNRLTFTLSTPSKVATYLSVAIFFLMYNLLQIKGLNRNSFIASISLIFLFAGVIITKSRTEFLIVGLMTAVLLVLHRRFFFFLSLMAIGLLLVTSFNLNKRMTISPKIIAGDEAMHHRYVGWEVAGRMFLEKPVIGHGFNSYRAKYQEYFANKDALVFHKYVHPELRTAHNMNLDALAETGILGFLTLNAIFILAFWRIRFPSTHDPRFILGVCLVFIYLACQLRSFATSQLITELTFFILGLCASHSPEKTNHPEKIS